MKTMKCVITKDEFGVSNTRFDRLLNKYNGNEVQLRRHYISRAARRALKAGMSEAQIRERYNPITKRVAMRGRPPRHAQRRALAVAA